MIESWKLCQAVKEALGAKRFAASVGRTTQTVYSWSRDPQDPEQDGSPNLFDWIEAVIDALAARPEGRTVLIQIRCWFIATIDRALSAFRPPAITRHEIAFQTGEAVQQFGEFLRECCPDSFDPERLLKEAAEVRDAIDRLMASVQEGVEQEERARATARRVLGRV